VDRGNHYEAAFEAYLQNHRHPYVAVDEARRSLWGAGPVKSLDFFVFGDDGARLVVDVKGRRYPAGNAARPRYVWESWATRDDVESLESWAALSGPGYQGVLVFAYDVSPDVRLPEKMDDLWSWRGRRYLLRGVSATDYRRAMRVRSPRWSTVALPQATFRKLVRPLRVFTRRQVVDACPF
jgi:hypothetical protein